MIFKARENHVLCLKQDKNRDIVAGSGGNGLIYRISRGGKAAVIFESPFEEVRTLAFDLDGNIYAAAGGAPKRGRKEDLPPFPRPRPRPRSHDLGRRGRPGASGRGVADRPRPRRKPKSPAARRRAKAERFSGRSRRPGETAVGFGRGDDLQPVLERGRKARLFRDGAERPALALGQGREHDARRADRTPNRFSSSSPVGVRTYLLANNPCSAHVLNPDTALRTASTLSPVLDARMISSWGRICWDAEVPAGTVCQFQTRSGNSAEPGPSWSDWSPPYQKADGEAILSPKARFIQFKALLTASAAKVGPSLDKSELFYLQSNVPPVVNRLDVLPVNDVFLKLPDTEDVILGLERRTADGAVRSEDPIRALIGQRRVQRKGFQTVQWDADDPNGDALAYTLSLRLDEREDWRVLEEGWTETTYAFNTVNFPDGIYLFKVTASDLPSNPRAQALIGERTSGAVVIDNTAPAVRNVQAVRESNGLNVSFAAEDAFSAIKEAKYLVRPDDWRIVFPEDGIADGKSESFKFRVPLDPRADGLLTIVVKDAAGNTAVFKQIF